MKKALRKHSLHGKTTASVFFPFISLLLSWSSEVMKESTPLMPQTQKQNPIFKCKQDTIDDP